MPSSAPLPPHSPVSSKLKHPLNRVQHFDSARDTATEVRALDLMETELRACGGPFFFPGMPERTPVPVQMALRQS